MYSYRMWFPLAGKAIYPNIWQVRRTVLFEEKISPCGELAKWHVCFNLAACQERQRSQWSDNRSQARRLSCAPVTMAVIVLRFYLRLRISLHPDYIYYGDLWTIQTFSVPCLGRSCHCLSCLFCLQEFSFCHRVGDFLNLAFSAR